MKILEGKIINALSLKQKHNKKFFNGFVTNKRCSISYYTQPNSKKPKWKNNRPIYIAVCIKDYTYFLRMQGLNGRNLEKINFKNLKNYKFKFLHGLYYEIKANKFNVLPEKDSIICFDIIFRVKTSKLKDLIDIDNDFFKETNKASLEFQINILEKMYLVAKKPPENFFYIEYDDHKFFQKYHYDTKGDVVNIVGKILYGNKYEINNEILNTSDNDISSNEHKDELFNQINNSKKLDMNLKDLVNNLENVLDEKYKELNNINNKNKINEKER